MIQLSMVVPCYNEEATLPQTAEKLSGLLQGLVRQQLCCNRSGIYFVDDGSSDHTWKQIETLAASSTRFHGIKLAGNRGHQNAILAGLLCAPGDALVSIDADLQDDISAVERMVQAHLSGAEIVYGVRDRRASDPLFKRLSALSYYKLLKLLGVDIVFNHADFRLMGRRAVEALGRYDEVNLFIRGIIPQLGFPTAIVRYERTSRVAGKSKYTLRKMLALALTGVTSFSVVPLRIIMGLGLGISLVSFVIGFWAISVRLSGTALPGWASTVLPMYFLGGIQLLSLGVIGEYLARVYLETKRRPRYIIERQTFGTSRQKVDDVRAAGE